MLSAVRRQSLGLIVVLALGMGAVFSVAAQPDEKELRAQGELIAALEAQLENLPAMPEASPRLEVWRAMLAEMKDLTGKKSLVRDDLREIEIEIRGCAGGNDAYRDAYLRWVRQSAVGETIPELVTVTGRTYRDVVVRSVTEAGLEIRHVNGSARLHYHVLPQEFQERFQWNPFVAEAVLRREARLAARMDQLRRSAVEREPSPFVSRLGAPDPVAARELHTPESIAAKGLDSPDSIKVRGLHSPDPIAARRIHSPGPVRARSLHSPDPIRTRRLHSPERITPLRLRSPRPVAPRSLERSGKIGGRG